MFTVSVCLSVSLSVILLRCVKTAERLEVLFWVETDEDFKFIVLDGESQLSP